MAAAGDIRKIAGVGLVRTCRPELALTAVFCVSAVIVFVVFFSQGGDFTQNVLPELFGFCLEGAVFVFLFSFFQNRRVRREAIVKKTALKSFLRNSLATIFAWAGQTEKGEPFERIFGPQYVDELIAGLQGRTTFHDISRTFVKGHAESLLPVAYHMIPVAASLDAAHMNSWVMVVNSLSGIRSAANEQQEIDAVIELLRAIKLFDRGALST